jgi:hypothetical protein
VVDDGKKPNEKKINPNDLEESKEGPHPVNSVQPLNLSGLPQEY